MLPQCSENLKVKIWKIITSINLVIALLLSFTVLWQYNLGFDFATSPEGQNVFKRPEPKSAEQYRTILFWNNYWSDGWFKIGEGKIPFKSCSKKNCLTTRNRTLLYDPEYVIDAILFHGGDGSIIAQEFQEIKDYKNSSKLVEQKNKGIIPKIILYTMESPFVGEVWSRPIFQEVFDLIVTYRLDSEIYRGYGSFIHKYTKKNMNFRDDEFHKYVDKNVSLTKYGITELSSRKKDIAWMVSHCITHSKREDYVNEMRKFKYLQIDIYGKCGNLSQPSRAEGWVPAYKRLAEQYKFYLSFENAKCTEYITEKFFSALYAGMIPVAMGGMSRNDYEKIAPSHSFIHVDDFSSPDHLMKFLYKLSKDTHEYNSYYWWKSYYDIGVYNYDNEVKCQLCDVLNSNVKIVPQKYENFSAYWDVCR